MSQRGWLRLAAAAWTILIFVATWTPLPEVELPHVGSGLFVYVPIDKVAHLALFAGFAFLWGLDLSPKLGWTRRVAFYGLVVAAISELGQMIPATGRDANLRDFAADVIGIVIGLGAARLASLLWKQDPRPGMPETRGAALVGDEESLLAPHAFPSRASQPRQ